MDDLQTHRTVHRHLARDDGTHWQVDVQWRRRADDANARGSEPSQAARCEQRRVHKAAAAEHLQKQLAPARLVLGQVTNTDAIQTLLLIVKSA
jgi:hypothetical protein